MKTIALIEKGADGTFGIYTPDLETTIVGGGATVEEAKKDFQNSVKEMITSYDGEVLPQELVNIDFIYKYDIASVFDFLDCLNVSKFAKQVHLNPSLLRQYKSGDTYISEAKVRQIERGLHDLGERLKAVSLI